MKKIILLLLSLVFLAGSCKKKSKDPEPEQAHFIVKDDSGNTVRDNQEFNFRQGSSLDLYITNTSSSTIHLKTKLISVSGDVSGQDMEFCFGNCYVGMDVGVAYPENSNFDLNGNATTQPGEIHYISHSTGTHGVYTIQIYEVNESGEQIGDALTFKYVFEGI